jgi:mannose-6-phosphate isomerase-like protein (cupin superfamily)
MIVTNIESGVAITTPEPSVRHVRVLLSPLMQEGLEDFAVGYTEMPPGENGSLHKHLLSAEIWLFFKGNGRATVGGEEIEIRPGVVVYTPRDTYHQVFNTGDEAIQLYYLYVPAGEEKEIIDGRFR